MTKSVADPADSHDTAGHVCVKCQLRSALTDWKAGRGYVDDVMEAICDLVQVEIGFALDEIFADDPAEPVSTHAPGHG